jgi:hypothetical protein
MRFILNSWQAGFKQRAGTMEDFGGTGESLRDQIILIIGLANLNKWDLISSGLEIVASVLWNQEGKDDTSAIASIPA